MSAAYGKGVPPPGRVADAGTVTRTSFRAGARSNPNPITDPVTSFRLAMQAAGLDPPDVIEADGQLHRFGRGSDRARWYVLHLGTDPHGAFGDWRTGLSAGWSNQNSRTLTGAELARVKQQMREQRQQQLAQKAEQYARAARRARSLFCDSDEAACTHAYLWAKRLPALGLHALGTLLLVPLFDEAGVLQSLQTIGADGSKRFMAGGRKRGLFCPVAWMIGEPLPALVIAEGWATAAACHLLTDTPTAAAMDAGNLLPVARAIRERYPRVHLTFAADHDGTGGGIGTQKATEAAQAVGNAVVIRPDCADDARADFADTWAAQRGAA